MKLKMIVSIICEGKTLLWTCVTPASTVIRCAGRVYDRNDEGDFDITDSPIQMENMYARKTGAFSENKFFSYATEDDLRMDLMPTVRRLIENKNVQHEWLKMTDHEIMISAGLYEKNLVTGEKGYNLAAIMLLGFLFTEIFPVLIQQNSLLKRTG